MNDCDRKRLGRLYSAIASLPYPNRSRSISPGDVAGFMSRIEELQPLILRSIMAISRCDMPSENPETELDDLEYELYKMKRGDD